MAVAVKPHSTSSGAARTVIVALATLIVGLIAGLVLAFAAVGLLPFIAGGTLNCSVNSNGSVTTCTDSTGQVVKVPHHIHIKQ